jgi:hypothetical protein
MRRLLFGLSLLPLTCRKSPPPKDPGGTVSVSWVGASTGHFSARGTGSWCPADSLVEILAVSNDSGVGLALITSGTVAPVQYPVLSSVVGADWRPMGFASLRVASDTALKGYEANSGLLQVTKGDPELVSGSIDVRLKLADGGDTLRMSGTFDRVAIKPAVGQCGRSPKPKAPPKPAAK